MGVGPFEILIILFVLMLIIGPRRVTNMARSLGRGVQDFVSEIGDKREATHKPSALGEGEEDEEKDQKPLNKPGKG